MVESAPKRVKLDDTIDDESKNIENSNKKITTNLQLNEQLVDMENKINHINRITSGIDTCFSKCNTQSPNIEQIIKERDDAIVNLKQLNNKIKDLEETNYKLEHELESLRKHSLDEFTRFAGINSEINLKLKTENSKLVRDLEDLSSKIKSLSNENQETKMDIELNEKNDLIDKLKQENVLLKTENAKAFSYAAFYVKKLQEFETLLSKERSERDSINTSMIKNALDESQNGMYLLGSNRYVRIERYNGNTIVNIREFFEKSGLTTKLPTKKGISLTTDQFYSLKNNLSKIENDIKKYN